ncbi:hypothetical protein B296_00048039 [Ensete ventricosum]|uniref:Uncharacterized protein n=1 Tax=Ensete ventricosum TaxID=4639 RepID=A0A426YND1_ENSVE|nr:hypothetical protein B296_00048039 [Ensete ventricosum]
MLIEDGSQGDLDLEAAAMVEEEDVIVEEEEGSSNVGYGYGATSWLQVEMVAAKVWLRQRDEGAVECTVIAEEGSGSIQ